MMSFIKLDKNSYFLVSPHYKVILVQNHDSKGGEGYFFSEC